LNENIFSVDKSDGMDLSKKKTSDGMERRRDVYSRVNSTLLLELHFYLLIFFFGQIFPIKN
jgi:hypothetical protein